MFEKALKLIKQYSTIIIHRHSNPDGDALGGQIGMRHLILDNYPDKKVFVVGDKPSRLEFIADRPMDEIPDSTYSGALAIILDTSSENMISDDRYKLADKTLRMDHHIFLTRIADEEVVDTRCESCCGVITEFAMQCNLIVSREAATALYTGIVTDSGRFRYGSTSSDTFRRTSFLLKCDIDINSIYLRLYSSSLESVKLRAVFTMKIQLTEHRVAYIYATKKELEELGLTAVAAARGYVNTMADIKGVNYWVAFAEGDDGIVCELRSAGDNINGVAVKYGGGGHAQASGATVPNKEIAMKVLKDLDRMAALR